MKEYLNTFKIFLILIGPLVSYNFFNYWIYPIYLQFPNSKSWFISSPGDGINLVATPRDTDEIGKILLSKDKIFLVNGYSVDKNVVHNDSNLFSSRKFSFNGQECSGSLSCEEIPIGSKFIIKKYFI